MLCIPAVRVIAPTVYISKCILFRSNAMKHLRDTFWKLQ